MIGASFGIGEIDECLDVIQGPFAILLFYGFGIQAIVVFGCIMLPKLMFQFSYQRKNPGSVRFRQRIFRCEYFIGLFVVGKRRVVCFESVVTGGTEHIQSAEFPGFRDVAFVQKHGVHTGKAILFVAFYPVHFGKHAVRKVIR